MSDKPKSGQDPECKPIPGRYTQVFAIRQFLQNYSPDYQIYECSPRSAFLYKIL